MIIGRPTRTQETVAGNQRQAGERPKKQNNPRHVIQPKVVERQFGGAYRIRTDDPLLAKQVL